jgi:DNA polymerase/3'-5' exonuclease PolX
VHRRVDIKTYLPDEMPFALLYFTGSGYFNRSMRRYADTVKGLSLHDRGFNQVRGNGMTAVRDAVFREEKDVFEYLGLEYVPPEDRSV